MSSRGLIRLFSSSSRACNYSNLTLTLFSKKNCGLCDTAKDVMSKILRDDKDLREKVSYHVVDIDDPQNKKWWDKYCFDIPVLHMEDHTQKGSLTKVFHRLDEKETTDKIEQYK